MLDWKGPGNAGGVRMGVGVGGIGVAVGSGVAVAGAIVAVKVGAGVSVGWLIAPAPQEVSTNDTNISGK